MQELIRHGGSADPAACAPYARRAWLARGMLLGAACACPAALAFAQQGFPDRPVRIVIGGGADQLARLLADQLSARYGKGVYVEERAGASGAIARDFVAGTPPDGYNWLLTTVAYTGQRILQPRPPQGELEPAAMFATAPFVLVVNNDLPVQSVRELVAHAQARPGKLNFASGGGGTPGHLSMEMLKQMAGIDIMHIPYKTVAQGLTGLMGNQVQVSCVPAPAVMALIKAGKVRALAVTSAGRDKSLPDVPTVAEQGYPDYLYVGWNSLHLAPRTPPDILDRVNADVGAVLDNPRLRAAANAVGYDIVIMNRQDSTAFLQADLERIAKVIRNGNIRATGA